MTSQGPRQRAHKKDPRAIETLPWQSQSSGKKNDTHIVDQQTFGAVQFLEIKNRTRSNRRKPQTAHRWTYWQSIVPIVAGVCITACTVLIKRVNGKFTPCPILTLIGLIIYFWLYISDQQRDKPITNPIHKNQTFPPKPILPRNLHCW